MDYQELPENAGVVRIVATLGNANKKITRVTITASGTALSGTDYNLSKTEIKFPATAVNGDTTSLLIYILDNNLVNYEKDLTLSFASAENCATIAADKKILIYDNEVAADPAQFETPFSSIPPTSNINMYEVNLRCFSSAGTLQGVQDRLDSIKALGINVIWLMPTYPIGIVRTVNSPYCVKDYYAVNTEYGDLTALRNLVREAHNRGMAVIMDWVANHTAWDNNWINNKSWYSQDGSGNIIIPPGTNWNDVADLNYNNSRMRQAMIKAMKFWILTANVDGYRCDAADMVPFDFWKQAIDSLHAIPGRNLILLAEGARIDHITAGFQMNYGWSYFSSLKSVIASGQAATSLFTSSTSEYSGMPSGSYRLRFTSNHDECAFDDTPLGLFNGLRGSMSAFVASAFMPGVTLIYNGQEIAYPVKLPIFSRSPIDWTNNYTIGNEYKQIMGVKNALAPLRLGDLTTYNDNDVLSFKRSYAGADVWVLINMRNTVVNYTVPAALASSSWTNAFTNTAVSVGTSATLQPYEYVVLKR